MGKLKDSRGHPFIYLYETQVRKESREGKESAAKGSNDVDPENLVVPFLSQLFSASISFVCFSIRFPIFQRPLLIALFSMIVAHDSVEIT